MLIFERPEILTSVQYLKTFMLQNVIVFLIKRMRNLNLKYGRILQIFD
jgi:hypothetical protein